MDFQAYAAQELTAVAEKLADTARRQLEATTAQLTANFDATIARLRHDHTQIVTENERLTAEKAALAREKEALLETVKTAARGPLIERLANVFECINSSQTIEDALVAAAHGLTADFGRVSVFAGEDRVAQLGAPAPPLEPDTPSAIVFPIVVRGQKIATIVAGDEAQPNGDGTRLADVLRRHVTLALDRLAVDLKAAHELRAYAQMLLDEVEYLFNADTAANVSELERRERLAENLRCARQIFRQRTTLEGPASASVLDEALSKVIDAKGDTAFARELVEVATAPV